MYEWKIVARDDRMGFVQTAEVDAYDFLAAACKAKDVFHNRGYKPGQLHIIEIRRLPVNR